MPENEDKSQEGPTAAQKKPGRQRNNGAKGSAREARLAEALRANLRRRKAPGPTDPGADDSGDKGTKEE